MNPEERLAVIHEHLAVKRLVLLLTHLVRVFSPKRIGIIDRLRSLLNFQLFPRRRDFDNLFVAVFSCFFLCLGFFDNGLKDHIILPPVCRINQFGLGGGIDIDQINRNGHKTAILLEYFPKTRFRRKLLTFLPKIKGNCSPVFLSGAVRHPILGTAVRLPVHRCFVLAIRLGFNHHTVGNHEGGVKSEPEMSDDLIFRRLVFVSLDKILCARKSNLIDILLHFFGTHTDAVVKETDTLLLRAHFHLNPIGLILQCPVLTHQCELL